MLPSRSRHRVPAHVERAADRRDLRRSGGEPTDHYQAGLIGPESTILAGPWGTASAPASSPGGMELAETFGERPTRRNYASCGDAGCHVLHSRAERHHRAFPPDAARRRLLSGSAPERVGGSPRDCRVVPLIQRGAPAPGAGLSEPTRTAGAARSTWGLMSGGTRRAREVSFLRPKFSTQAICAPETRAHCFYGCDRLLCRS